MSNCLRSYLLASFCLLLSFSTVLGQTPCENGEAGGFPCENVELLSRVSLSEMGCNGSNDLWGWTDPMTGREYAIFGCTDRTTFVDITDPINPVFLGHLMGHNNAFSTWRDMKVYANHAYIVSEANGHGVQVFDLTQLRDVSNAPATFEETSHLGSLGNGRTISNSHNIVINEESGFAYTVGNRSLCGSGLTAIDLSEPADPVFAGCFSADGYTHDAQCVNYKGPDSDYANTEICFNSNEDALTIVDVTDKDFMVEISSNTYPGVAYTHQGWLTEDHQYFLMNDEVDELNRGHNTRTYIWDVRNLDFPRFLGYYEAPLASIDHNLYIKGNYAYLSNYSSGLRILDISDIANANLEEVASFDVFPQNNSANFDGSWSNYPFFESGSIIVSERSRGLFIVRFNQPDAHCFNGVMDENETGVDCGGTCTACPTCDDGILNADESGIDCGGASCPTCPSEECATYNFTDQVLRYDARYNDQGIFSLEDNGSTIFISENGWKAIEINYEFTPATVIEFDFKSEVEGEIHEFSFDNNLLFTPDERYVVYGTQSFSGSYAIPKYSGSGDWEHFTIEAGTNFTGTFKYLVLNADDDAAALGESYYSNIKIYEDYNGDLTCISDAPPVNCDTPLRANEVDELLQNTDNQGYGTVLLEHHSDESGYFYEVRNLCPMPAGTAFLSSYYTCSGDYICGNDDSGFPGNCLANEFDIDLSLATSSIVVGLVNCSMNNQEDMICAGESVSLAESLPTNPPIIDCCIPQSTTCMDPQITITPDQDIEMVDGTYIATPMETTTYLIDIDYGNNCAPQQLVHTVVVDQNCPIAEPQIFIDHPWLYDVLDPSTCSTESIVAYTVGVHTYYQILTEDGAVLYTSTGTFLCADSPNYDCVSLYGFTDGVAVWACGDDKPGTFENTDIDYSLARSDFKLYPNPTTGILYVESSQESDTDIIYQVYDVEGKLVLETVTVGESTITQLDFSQQVSGIYFIKKIKNNVVDIQRFIIER